MEVVQAGVAAEVDIEGQIHVENRITVIVSLTIDFRVSKMLIGMKLTSV